MSGNLTGKIFIFVGMISDLEISAVVSGRTEAPRRPRLVTKSQREKLLFLQFESGGWGFNSYLTDR